MKKQKKEIGSRKDVGKRFQKFRMAINKAQRELAIELNISQSTIANIENGKAFPSLLYLYYLYYKYQLDANWLLFGVGNTFKKEEKMPEKHAELLELLKVPFIAQQILAKFVEVKVLLKDEIKTYFENGQDEITCD